jgi:hypothetical protein
MSLYDTSNPLQKEQFKARSAKLAESGKVVELTEKKPKRSLQSNKYLHVILGYFETGNTLEWVKQQYYKKLVNPSIFIRERDDKYLGRIKILRSSADLDSGEMATSITRFRNWASAECGIYLPSSEEDRLIQLMKGIKIIYKSNIMDKFLGQEIPEKDRWQFLQDNADAVEEIGYTHRFTPDELAQKKESLAETSIKINDIEIEKKEVMDGYKEQLKPLNEEKQKLLENIKKGSEYVEDEECVKILYHEEKMAGYYDRLGELVYSRPIMPQEMQKTIFNINRKTGTND